MSRQRALVALLMATAIAAPAGAQVSVLAAAKDGNREAVRRLVAQKPAEVNAAETGASAAGKANVIAAEAVAVGDIRTLSNEQEDRVRAKMQAIVARHLPKTDAALTFADTGYPAMAPTEGNKALLVRLNGVNKTLGLPEMPQGDPAKRGAGDISFVAFIDGLVGLGMAGEGSHAPGETADLTSLDVQANRAALLMHRLSKEPRAKR